jgi:hypothetical protein
VTDRDTTLAAWRRHVPDVRGDEMDALLPLIVERSALLPLAIDAYRVGYAAALAELEDNAITASAIGADEDPELPTVLEVGVRFNKENRGYVTLTVDGHLFISVAGWDTDEAAEVARQHTEETLRGLLGLAAADPSDAAIRDRADQVIAGLSQQSPLDAPMLETLRLGVNIALAERFNLRAGRALRAAPWPPPEVDPVRAGVDDILANPVASDPAAGFESEIAE